MADTFQGKMVGANGQLRLHAALVTVQVLFASLAIAGRYVLPVVPPGALVFFRVAGAAAVLVGLNVARGGPWVRAPRDLRQLAVLGLVGIALNQSLFLFGLRFTPAINATILVTTTPVFTVCGAILLGREPVSFGKLFGIALAAIGSVYLVGPERLSWASRDAVGNLLIVCGMVCYAAYFLFSRAVLARHDSLTATALIMSFALVGVVPVGVPGLIALTQVSVAPHVWLWVAYIVAGPTILTYLLNIWALRRASSNVVAVYIYLQPVLTAAVAPLLLAGEHLTPRATVAALAIFGGLASVVWAEVRQRRTVPVSALAAE